jgi:hypothetical protein
MTPVKQLQQDVEHSHDISQVHLNVSGQTMTDPFQVTNNRQHGKDRFNTHPLIPSAFLADFHVLWNAFFGSKAKFASKGYFAKQRNRRGRQVGYAIGA